MKGSSSELQTFIAELSPAEKAQILSFLIPEPPRHAVAFAGLPAGFNTKTRRALEVFVQLNDVRQGIVLGTMRVMLAVQRGNESRGITTAKDAALYYGRVGQ